MMTLSQITNAVHTGIAGALGTPFTDSTLTLFDPLDFLATIHAPRNRERVV
jgi:hypothetical protein